MRKAPNNTAWGVKQAPVENCGRKDARRNQEAKELSSREIHVFQGTQRTSFTWFVSGCLLCSTWPQNHARQSHRQTHVRREDMCDWLKWLPCTIPVCTIHVCTIHVCTIRVDEARSSSSMPAYIKYSKCFTGGESTMGYRMTLPHQTTNKHHLSQDSRGIGYRKTYSMTGTLVGPVVGGGQIPPTKKTEKSLCLCLVLLYHEETHRARK